MQFMVDVNFRGTILRGLQRRDSSLEIIRAQDVGLDGIDDRELLAWAAERGCILLTHDRATVPDAAWQRVTAGLPMPGVIVVDAQMRTGQAI